MARWCEFEAASPDIAAAGRKLLFQFGPGLGYLATVRRDGGPRVHPFCPILFDGGLYGLIGPSPKRADLLRDGRVAIHSFPAVEVDDEFYLTGRALRRDDAALEAGVRAAFAAGGSHSSKDELVFEFELERALLATYKKRGTPDAFPPKYAKWHATGEGDRL